MNKKTVARKNLFKSHLGEIAATVQTMKYIIRPKALMKRIDKKMTQEINSVKTMKDLTKLLSQYQRRNERMFLGLILEILMIVLLLLIDAPGFPKFVKLIGLLSIQSFSWILFSITIFTTYLYNLYQKANPGEQLNIIYLIATGLISIGAYFLGKRNKK